MVREGIIKILTKIILYTVLFLLIFGSPAFNVKAGSYWQQVGGNGLGDPDNTVIITMETWNNVIYAGIKNDIDGARIYRSTNGSTWTKVSTDGFGHLELNALNAIVSLKAFNGRLYASVVDDDIVPTQTAEIWSTADGITWTQSGDDGLGNANNKKFFEMAVFDSQLYVGSYDTTGADIYRTADGITWEVVINDGFGDPNNDAIWGLYSFGDRLWAGTFNNVDGPQVWRSDENDGTSWNLYMDYDGVPFLDDVTAINHFFEFNGLLYWFGIDATNGANIAQRQSDIFHVFYIGGIGDVKNIWFSQNTVVAGGSLYFGTRNDTTGGELWYTNNITDGNSFTQIGLDGFGNVDNFAIYALTFKNYLYIGLSTVNGLKGAEIWRRVTTSSSNNINIRTENLPNGTQGSTYETSLEATGGKAPYSWNLFSGRLPLGLSLNSQTGKITGIPEESGEFSIRIYVTDSSRPQKRFYKTFNLKMVAGATSAALEQVTTLPETGAPISFSF